MDGNYHRIGSSTITLISNYYAELIKNRKTKTTDEICDDLGISTKTLSKYWNIIGITTENIGYEHSKYVKLVLIHTSLSPKSIYYGERNRVLEEQRKKRNYQILMKLKEQAELKKARAQLVETLSKVAVKKIR